MNKTIKIFHHLVEMLMVATIATGSIVSVLYLGGWGGSLSILLILIVAGLTVPAIMIVKKIINYVFNWIEDAITEEMEEA